MYISRYRGVVGGLLSEYVTSKKKEREKIVALPFSL